MQLAFVTDDPQRRNVAVAAAAAVVPSARSDSLLDAARKASPIAVGLRSQCRLCLDQICLRPNPIDHPQFTGSNPQMNNVDEFLDQHRVAIQQRTSIPANLQTPPWDVDNNGDGVPDSVWLDLGAPVQSAPDGRLYKPLFAILCVDLDGRLNVNTVRHDGTDRAGRYTWGRRHLPTQLAPPLRSAGGGPRHRSGRNHAFRTGQSDQLFRPAPILRRRTICNRRSPWPTSRP